MPWQARLNAISGPTAGANPVSPRGVWAAHAEGFLRLPGPVVLAGAVAYYASQSIVPLLSLTEIALAHVVEQGALLQIVGRYLEWLVPGQSKVVVAELANFIAQCDVLGCVLLANMLFFSSMAFTVLENVMSDIFHHRVTVRRRHFLISAVIPYVYILSLGLGLLTVPFTTTRT